MKISSPRFLSICFTLAMCWSHSHAQNDESTPPNVIIFFTDDHGTIDLNCFGASDLITPNMDRLATSGIKFTQAYAHKYCCPARAGLMTGRYPQRTGVGDWTQGDRKETDRAMANMKLEEITVAEVLQSAGYATGLFGKWHLGAKEGHGPLEQGFDRFFGHLGGFIDNYNHHFLHWEGFHDLYDQNEEIFREGEYFPDMMMKEALEFIEGHQDQPFFAYVAFNLPHYPEQPINEYAEAYADLPMPRQSYARVVSTVDAYVGQVLDLLEEKGLRDNTIIVLQGDNGHSREDKGRIDIDDHTSGFPRGHYYSAYGGGGNTGKWIGAKGDYLEGGIRTPAILSFPNHLPQGESRDQLVTVMDWFPTILELTGIPLPEVKIDGESVIPLLDDPDAATRHPMTHFDWPNGWAIREGDWKLIGKRNKNTGVVKLSLHSLADPEPEVKDYLGEKPDLVERLKLAHESWEAEVNAR
ncbi:MAG: sulfatase-like hydrolase/transferase [Verrucomicrobiota bacterium]